MLHNERAQTVFLSQHQRSRIAGSVATFACIPNVPYIEGQALPRRGTMARRARPSGRRLTETDAAVVKGMAERGDRHHDIAAWFGVNQGRIAEVLARDTFPHSAI